MSKDEALAQILFGRGLIRPDHWQSFLLARQANPQLLLRDELILQGIVSPSVLEAIEQADLLSTLRHPANPAPAEATAYKPPAPEPARSSLQKIGNYKNLQELGRGGFGVVFRGLSESGQPVAIKLLLRQDFESGTRFDREARLLGELGAEDGFVPLLDWGTTERGPYIVMPFLGGGTLANKIKKEGALSVDSAIALLSQLAAAIGQAHQRGILHRDLKPENILFDEHGSAFIADLGLGKHFHSDKQSISLSASGQSFGTLGYMPPEQMSDARRVGPQADVFALGAILYFSLTGERPFQGKSFYALASAIEGGGFIPLHKRLASCPAGLSELVDSCLSPSPSLRPQDGHELYSALSALRSPAISPRGPRRQLALALGLISLIIALASLFIREGPEQASGGGPPPGALDSPPLAKPLERESTAPKPGSVDAPLLMPLPPPLARPASWTILGGKLRQSQTLGSALGHHGGAVTQIRSGFQGRVIASASADCCVRLWSSESGQKLLSFSNLSSQPLALAFDPKDSFLLIGDESGKISAHSVALRGIERSTQTSLGPIRFLAFNRAGDVLISASDQGVALWNWPDISPRELPKGADWGFASRALTTVPDGDFLSLKASDVFLWNESKSESLFKQRASEIEPPGTLGVCAMAMGRDPTKIYAALSDRSLRLYDCGPTNLRTLASSRIPSERPNSRPTALALTASGKPVVALSDGSIRRLSSDLVVTEQLYGGHRGSVTDLIAASANGALYSASEDSSLRRWTEAGLESWPQTGHSGGVRALRFLNPERLLSAGGDGGLLQWRLGQTQSPIEPEALHQFSPDSGVLWAFGPDNKFVSIASTLGEIGLARLDKNLVRWTRLFDKDEKIHRVSALDLGHNQLLAGDSKGRLTRYSYSAGTVKRESSEELGDSSITALTQSPQGWEAVGFAKGEVRFRRVSSKDLSWRTLSLHSSGVSALLLISEDLLASSAENGRLVLTSLSTQSSVVLSPESPGGEITGLARSPDGSSLAVVFARGLIGFYDIRGPFEEIKAKAFIVKLIGFDERLQGIAFSPSGRQLAIGSGHGPITVFDITDP